MFLNKVLCFLSISMISSFSIADDNKLSNSLKPVWNITATDRLRHNLLNHYDKFARPMQHYNTTTVGVGLTVFHIEINEFKSTFTVHGWVSLTWNDDKLKWNSSEYDGLGVLHLADHEIWQPDVVPYNNAAGSTVDHYANTHILVFESGTVLWVPPIKFVVFCELNLRYWPFDEQNCWIKLGSWTYHGYAMNLTFRDNKTEVEVTDMIVKNTEWRLLKTSAVREDKIYPCCTEPYPSITFSFTVRRHSPTYSAIIITPAFAVIVMTLSNFWLPPYSEGKIFLNCCTAAIICLLLLFFSQKGPAMGDHIPLIVLFYSSSLYVISFCVIGSVLVIWISRTQHHRSLPKVIKQALTGWLGKSLGLTSYIHQTSMRSSDHPEHGGSVTSGEELRDQQQGASVGLNNASEDVSNDHHMPGPLPGKYESGSHHHDWLLLAAAIDRLSFVFYAFLFLVFTIAYSI